jgi:hypothetical protein
VQENGRGTRGALYHARQSAVNAPVLADSAGTTPKSSIAAGPRALGNVPDDRFRIASSFFFSCLECPMTRLVLVCCAVALAGSLGCDRTEELVNSATETAAQVGEMADEAAEGATGAVAELGEAAEQAAGAVVAAVAPSSEGTSLNELVAEVPSGVTSVIYIDLASVLDAFAATSGQSAAELREAAQTQLQVLVAETPELASLNIAGFNSAAVVFWPTANDDKNVLIISQPEMWTRAPVEGAAPIAFQESGDEPFMVVRNGNLYIGNSDSPAFLAVTAGVAAADRYEGSAAWSQGWEAAGADSLLSVFISDVMEAGALLELNASELRRFEAAGFTRFAMNITPDGAATVVADLRDEALLLNTLGHAQWSFEQLMMQARPMAIPVVSGWIGYLDLVNKAAWSRLSVRRDGTISTLALPVPTCGTALSYVLLGGLYGGLAMEGDEPPQPQAYRPVEQRVADNCNALPGPAPSLPANRTNLAGNMVTPESGLVLLDFAALLRQGLPTMFGTLPFALHADDITAAFGATPMGLAGLNDANGHIALAFADGAGGPTGTMVLPDGTFGMLPLPPSPEIVNQRLDGVGYVVGTPGAEQRAAAPRNATSPWSEIVDAMPADSLFGGAMDASALDELYSATSPKPAAFNFITLIGVSMAADFQPRIHFHTTGGAATLEPALRAELERMSAEMMTELSQEIGAGASTFERTYREMLEQLSFSSSGNVVTVNYDEQLFNSGTAVSLATAGFVAAILAEAGLDMDYAAPAPTGGKP